MALLRRNRHTVDELASEVRLTDNAVRAHLIALKRDDLVRQGDVRRGIGKPAYTYTLTPQAERLFPKAYGLVLREILGQRIPRDALTDALHEVGYRLAAPHLPGNDPRHTRVDNAVALLDDLGGLAESESTEMGYRIRGQTCPLSEAVEDDTGICVLAETLLADVIGAPVQAVCDTDPVPRCRFVIDATTTADDHAAQGEGGMPGEN